MMATIFYFFLYFIFYLYIISADVLGFVSFWFYVQTADKDMLDFNNQYFRVIFANTIFSAIYILLMGYILREEWTKQIEFQPYLGMFAVPRIAISSVLIQLGSTGNNLFADGWALFIHVSLFISLIVDAVIRVKSQYRKKKVTFDETENFPMEDITDV